MEATMDRFPIPPTDLLQKATGIILWRIDDVHACYACTRVFYYNSKLNFWQQHASVLPNISNFNIALICILCLSGPSLELAK